MKFPILIKIVLENAPFRLWVNGPPVSFQKNDYFLILKEEKLSLLVENEYFVICKYGTGYINKQNLQIFTKYWQEISA